MYLPTKQSDHLTELARKMCGLAELLCQSYPSAEAAYRVAPTQDLFAELPPTRLLRIKEGSVDYHINGKLLVHFEAGDLLGLTRALSLPCGTFSNTGALEVEAYERDIFIEHTRQDLSLQRHWSHFLLCNLSFFEQALTQELRSEFQPSAGFLHFSAGDTIIQQGQSADRVYTLLEGTAIAECDGVKVGDIDANEIFGALAVFTRQARMASVIASSDCTVLAVRKEEFIELINHQPQICLGLIEEMAAKINQLNAQLCEYKNS
jgi:CRP/FNR family transcriptional regulator, cyclic AMP receptor protein